MGSIPTAGIGLGTIFGSRKQAIAAPAGLPLASHWLGSGEEPFRSRRNCPKYLADGLEATDIRFLGAARDFVEPAHRGRLQTRFG